MRVAVVLEQRFTRTPDGRVWTNETFPYSFFRRYLEVFETVRVLARVRPAAEPGRGWLEAAGPGVELVDLPDYHGPAGYLIRRFPFWRALERALEPPDPVILRAPSQAAFVAAGILARQDRGFAAEVVGDPADALARGACRHPLRPVFRFAHTRLLGGLCRQAVATAYVTERALQRRYPPFPGRPTTHYSSVELRDEAFVEAPRPQPATARRLISVGSMEHLYKGHDTLLRALARCRREGLDLRLTLVGDGRCRPWLERLARELDVDDAVRFAGRLPSGAAVRRRLDQADLFVLASRQEGLPRALLEAMARGLPAVATSVGGVPELLAAHDRAPPDAPEELARLIGSAASSAERRDRMARAGWNLARRYREEVLAPRRRSFYEKAAALLAHENHSPRPPPEAAPLHRSRRSDDQSRGSACLN